LEPGLFVTNGLLSSKVEYASFVGDSSNTSSIQTAARYKSVPKKKKKGKAAEQQLTHHESLDLDA
jgi:hypothetical protein